MLKMTQAEYALSQIKNYPNKSHWRIREFTRQVELQISNYRVTALKFKGTYPASVATQEANRLEKELMLALKGF